MPRRRKSDFTLEEVARMVLQKRAPAEEPVRSERRVAVTLPYVSILGPLPAWWDEDFERRPVMAKRELTCHCGGMHRY